MEPPLFVDGSDNEQVLTTVQLAERFLTKCVKCQAYAVMIMRKASQRYIDDYHAHRITDQCGYYRKPKKGNGTHSGIWAFTLTMSPEDALGKPELLRAVRKIMAQKSCPTIRYAWHYEDKGVDSSGRPIHPHIHGLYETASGGRIEAKHFKRAWKIWDESLRMGSGFRGGYHRPVRSDESYSAYIAKDGKESDYYNIDDATQGDFSPEEGDSGVCEGAA